MQQEKGNFKGKTYIVTGAGGALCSAMSLHLAQLGGNIVLIGRTESKLIPVSEQIKNLGGKVLTCTADVTSEKDLYRAKEDILSKFGGIDALINGAGGNQAEAVTTLTEYSPLELEGNTEIRGFFNLNMQIFNSVLVTNTMGTVLPCFIFGKAIAAKGGGNIINIASMNSYRPLSRVPAYAMAKAGIVNFTQWLAAYLSPANIRVNAIAPGFFPNERSRAILYNPDGSYSRRGENVIAHTPMRRFGEPKELLGALEWLLDDEKASYVTGITIPIDGGFLSSSGV